MNCTSGYYSDEDDDYEHYSRYCCYYPDYCTEIESSKNMILARAPIISMMNVTTHIVTITITVTITIRIKMKIKIKIENSNNRNNNFTKKTVAGVCTKSDDYVLIISHVNNFSSDDQDKLAILFLKICT